MIFYFNHFSLIIFYHSVWLGFELLGYNRCVTGRRLRDENDAVRFRQSAENRSRAWDTQPIRSVSDELARGCKRWHPLAPRRRYGKKKSSFWVYVSLSISQLTTNGGPLLRIKWGIYFYKVFRSLIEFCSLCMWHYNICTCTVI